MLSHLGMPELLIIGAVVLLIFGPRQLPQLGRSVAETIRSFRAAGREVTQGLDDADTQQQEDR